MLRKKKASKKVSANETVEITSSAVEGSIDLKESVEETDTKEAPKEAEASLVKKEEPKEAEAYLVKKEEPKETALAASSEPHYGSDLIDDTESDSRDILIPKILLMQGLSEFVADEKAEMGDIVESLNAKKLASKGGEVELIPFFDNKTWNIFLNDEYVETVPNTPANAHWEWTEETSEGTIRRVQSLNFFFLLASDPYGLPHVISFRSTSYKAGKALTTQKEKLKRFKQPLCAQTVIVSGKKEKNEKGTFYVWEVRPGRATTKEEIDAVRPWFDIAKTQRVKVDESELQNMSSNEDEAIIVEGEESLGY